MPDASFNLVWLCHHQLLSEFLAKDHLPQMSRQLRMTANDNDGNEMIQGTVHRSPGIYLRLRKIPENFS